MLQYLAAHGIAAGVATNDAEATAEAHLAALGLRNAFRFVAGYDSGHGAKPLPGMVLAFADALGVEPSEIAMIGDSPHDIAAARGAGAYAIGIARTPRARAALGDLPDVVVTSMSEVVPALAAAFPAH